MASTVSCSLLRSFVGGCVLAVFLVDPPCAEAKGCKPDVSTVDPLSKKRNEIWGHAIHSTGFGKKLLTDRELRITATVGRYGTFNAIKLEILDRSTSDPWLESTMHAARGRSFALGFRGREGLAFKISDAGKQPNLLLLIAAISDNEMAQLRATLTTYPIDFVRIPLAGDRHLEKAVEDEDGNVMRAKFSCFYEFLDEQGISLTAPTQSPQNSALSGRPCAEHYSQEGDPNDATQGMVYKSFVEVKGTTVDKTYIAIGRKMTNEGYLGVTVNKDLGIVTGYQEDNGKKSTLHFTLTETDPGAVRVEGMFRMAKGLRIPEDAARVELCKLLE